MLDKDKEKENNIENNNKENNNENINEKNNEKVNENNMPNKNKKGEKSNKNNSKFKINQKHYPIFFAALIFLIIMFALIFSQNTNVKEEYNYNNFLSELKSGEIEKVTMTTGSRNLVVIRKSEEQIEQEKKEKTENEGKSEEQLKVEEELKKEEEQEQEENNETEKKTLTKEEQEDLKDRTETIKIPTIEAFTIYIQDEIDNGNNVILEVISPPGYLNLINLFFNLLPTILIVILIIITIKMQGFGNKGKVYDDEANEKINVKFSDVAGLDEEKAELIEIVDFLQNPEKYRKMGAKIPRGILLYGKPGTGKTLVAKAIAGEARVPFISMSGSEFIEMFAGLGASRVRKLFEQARSISPSIIFIDEIDAIGTQRNSGGSGGETESNQTLNQLLVEMDGFNSDSDVIVLAATNRPELLDKALLRPGRFDRQITIPSPDKKGRKEILELHARGKKIADDVDFDDIAGDTAGFTGAELANILNEAAILATRHRKEEVSYEDIDEALKKVMVGLEKQNRVTSAKDIKITAYHEAGHAVVSRYLPTQENVKEISIIPRGHAGGYTMYKTTEDKSYISKTELRERMISLMGGRAAEELIIGDISTGASNDLEVATDIARNMITLYGMSDKIGPISLNVKEYYELELFGKDTVNLVGNEIKIELNEAYKSAIKILAENIDKLHEVAEVLLEKEKISGKEFDLIFGEEETEEENK